MDKKEKIDQIRHNKHFSSADNYKEKNKYNNNDDNKIKNIESKRLKFTLSNDKILKEIPEKSIKKFSQKNKIIFREFLKRTLIKKGDKESLLIECLKKDPQTRNKEDINTIKNFLLSSKLINALLTIPFFDQKNCDNFLTSISNEVRLKTLKQEDILFKIGTKVDYFYIIYSGSILIEGLERYTIPLTCKYYIKSIIDKYKKIYNYKDKYALTERKNLINYEKILLDNENNKEVDILYSKYILEKTLESNKNIVNIEEEEIPLLNLILLIIDIKNLFNNIRGNYSVLLLLIQDYNYDHEKILNGMEYLSNNFFVHNVEVNMKQIYKNVPEVNPELIEKYEKIIESNNNYNFYHFRKGRVIRLQNMGECFGDISPEMKFNINNNNIKRNYTVSILEDSILAYIPFDKFNEALKIEKEEIKNNESKFLKSSFFFKDISPFLFTKKYLKYFIYEELLYNNHLFTEGSKNNYVYFLKFGKYEIYCQKSIKKICELINEMSNKFLDSAKKNEFIQITNSILKKIQWCSFIKKEFLNDNPMKLFVLTKNFMLGLESLYNDLPYLYNVRILSEKCGYYKIEYKYLYQIMSEIKNGKELLMHEQNYYLELILERLINISQKKVKFINHENKSDMLYLENISNHLKANKGKIKNKIITHKFKDYLEKNNTIKFKMNNIGNNNNLCLTARNEDNLFKKNNRINPYFITELNDTNNNENKIYKININKLEYKNLEKINKHKILNRNNHNELKYRNLSLNNEYNPINKNSFLKTYNNNKYNNNIIHVNKKSKYNPVEIKNEENLTKKIKKTLESELLFFNSFRVDKNNKNNEKVKIESKNDIKDNNRKIDQIINTNLEENDNKLYYQLLLPYHNSSKNIKNSLKIDFPKRRNLTRNKKRNIYPMELKNDEKSFTKYTLSNNSNWIEKKIGDDTIINNIFRSESTNTNKYNDDEKNKTNDYFYDNKTQNIFDNKNKYKRYQKFNRIQRNFNMKQNIENYCFKGKKNLTYYKEYYNKQIYKSFKEKVEDSLFMNGQTLSPKINYEYY